MTDGDPPPQPASRLDARLGRELPATPLVRRALAVAAEAHTGRVRKGGAEPEIRHPVAVATLVTRHGFDDTAVAAALLHDVVEDTALEPEDLLADFPAEVCRIVADLTEDRIDGPRSASWERRKASKLARLESAGEVSLAVCAADRIHNMESVVSMLRERGDAALEPFSRPPDAMLRYERRIAAIVRRGLAHPLVDRLEAALAAFERAVEGATGSRPEESD